MIPSPGLSVLARVGTEQHPLHRLLGGRPLSVPEDKQIKKKHLTLNILWEIVTDASLPVAAAR